MRLFLRLLAGLLATLFSIATLAMLGGCGGGGGEETVSLSASPTATEMVSPSPTASVSPTPMVSATATPVPLDGVPSTQVSGDDPRVVEAAAQGGFAEFAAEFQRAVEANNVEYLVQRAHHRDIECTGADVFPVLPRNCLAQPQGLVVPAIPYGIWNSEGGYYSPEQYTEFVVDRLNTKAAPNAHVYAFGHHIRGASEGDGGVDIVVADVRSPSGGGPVTGSAVVFRVALVEGEWLIVGVNRGVVELIDDFFDWWVPWEAAFPEAPGG